MGNGKEEFMSLSLSAKLGAFDPTLPLERAHTIPSSWYLDPELYALECRGVFGATWQAVGRTAQVARPGTFLTADVAGEPILVVRDEQGVLRAFHNVCRHRAAQVINEPEGKASRLRCRYHGWTYDLTGRLRGTPEFDGVADFCKGEQGLVPLAVDVWGPLVWVHDGATAAPPLAEFLAPLPEQTAGLGLEQMQFVERRSYELACNWKVFVDNFLDGGYHVNTVHPGLADVLNYSEYRTHLFAHTSMQTAPLRQADDETVGKVRSGRPAQYWWIFPNLMINIYQDVMDTNLVLPLGPDRCKVLFDFYFTHTQGAEAEAFIRQSIAVGHQVQHEDVTVCEEVQRGLRSRSFSTGRFSGRREAGGYHFHRLLAAWLQAAHDRTRSAG
jgi:choline monooxygenase